MALLVRVHHDLWVVADEVYAHFVFEGEFNHIASLPGMSERTVTIGSMSKSYAMSGNGWSPRSDRTSTQTSAAKFCWRVHDSL